MSIPNFLRLFLPGSLSRLKLFPAFLLLLTTLSSVASAQDLYLGTKQRQTFSYFCGEKLCAAINNFAPDVRCQAVAGKSAIHNLTNLSGGSLDLCLADSRLLYDAMHKSGHFAFMDIEYDKLRVLASVFDLPITLVVRRDAQINSLDNLKGKRLNIGSPGSHNQLAFSTILEAKDWSRSDFSLLEELPSVQSQSSMALCHGRIQAMLHIGVHPDPALNQLLKLCQVSFVNMQDLDIQATINRHSAYYRIKIAANTYPSITEDIATFGTKSLLLASAEMGEQDVYRILKAIFEYSNRLKLMHPGLVPSPMQDQGVAGAKLHPGAIEYFNEHGGN